MLMPKLALLIAPLVWFPLANTTRADDAVAELRRDLDALRLRIEALEKTNALLRSRIDVERLVVRRELIVSDTASPWEAGFERHEIARGIYARSLGDGTAGLWVRGRLIKAEIDDPFDDRFHAIERDGRLRRAPGHISWNVWLGDAWRQMAILQGEAVEFSETPESEWSGGNHPGRLRLQSFRPGHPEPMTDALIGQGKMSIGGGGYGGGGLPLPGDVLEIWGGQLRQTELTKSPVPTVVSNDGSGQHQYSLIAVGAHGRRAPASAPVRTTGKARLRWNSEVGADAYVIVRDGVEITPPIRIEGSQKSWTDEE